MKKVALLLSAAGLGISQGIRAWMRTLRYRVAYHDPALDPMHGCDQPRLYVFWHEYILLPLYIRGQLRPHDAAQPAPRRGRTGQDRPADGF